MTQIIIVLIVLQFFSPLAIQPIFMLINLFIPKPIPYLVEIIQISIFLGKVYMTFKKLKVVITFLIICLIIFGMFYYLNNQFNFVNLDELIKNYTL